MREDISSLMDSEFLTDSEFLKDSKIRGDRSDVLIEHLNRDEEARDTWATYHLIGDALRGDGGYRPGVQGRIFAKLAEEPTILAPRLRTVRFPAQRSVRVGMAVAASVATLSVVAWMARQEVPAPMVQDSPATLVAQMPAAIPAQGLEVQPVNLNEYLQAHEEFSPYTGGYRLANVTSLAPTVGSGAAPVSGGADR